MPRRKLALNGSAEGRGFLQRKPTQESVPAGPWFYMRRWASTAPALAVLQNPINRRIAGASRVEA